MLIESENIRFIRVTNDEVGRDTNIFFEKIKRLLN